MEENPKYSPFKVMTDPRGFMRSPAAQVRGLHWILAAMVGFVWLLGKFYLYALGMQYTLVQILIGSLIFAIPVGLVIFCVSAFCLHLTGKIFRGKGTFKDLYSAFAWSRVPEFFQLISWIALIVMNGRSVFTPALVAQDQMSVAVLILLVVQIVFSFWKSIILFHTVGEVQGFSAWIAIWNVVFAWVLLLCIDYGVNVLVSVGLNYQTVAMQTLLHI